MKIFVRDNELINAIYVNMKQHGERNLSYDFSTIDIEERKSEKGHLNVKTVADCRA